MWSIRPEVDQLKMDDPFYIVLQKLKKVNFDHTLIQNQLNDSGDFEVRVWRTYFNSTAAFFS